MRYLQQDGRNQGCHGIHIAVRGQSLQTIILDEQTDLMLVEDLDYLQRL